MKRMAQLLRDIRNGKTKFEIDRSDPKGMDKFQADATRLIEAEKRRYVEGMHPIKQPMPGSGQLGYTAIIVTGGLTFPGEQFLSENLEDNPDAEQIHDQLHVFRSEYISNSWQKALGRIEEDPSGAITAARSLLESVFKKILEEKKVEFSKNDDFGVLWKKVSKVLDLGLSNDENEMMKRFLGACNSMIGSLAELRNRSGDAHGGKGSTVDDAHSRLIVNISGAFAGFLADISSVKL
jgi:hypothetical protein